MALTGIRGATTVDVNNKENIWSAAQLLMTKLMSANRLKCEQIGAALEIPQDILLKKFQSSYSASRGALLEAWKSFRTYRQWFVSDFCDPVYGLWMYEAVARGRIRAPGFFQDPAIRQAWLGVQWVGPAQGQIDPLKEINAEILACQHGFSTGEDSALRINGSDFDANIDRLRREAADLAAVQADWKAWNSGQGDGDGEDKETYDSDDDTDDETLAGD